MKGSPVRIRASASPRFPILSDSSSLRTGTANPAADAWLAVKPSAAPYDVPVTLKSLPDEDVVCGRGADPVDGVGAVAQLQHRSGPASHTISPTSP